jgi:hypothetical protein
MIGSVRDGTLGSGESRITLEYLVPIKAPFESPQIRTLPLWWRYMDQLQSTGYNSMRAPLIITLICFAAPLASDANVPDFDTKGYCKKINYIVNQQSGKNYDYCIHSEKSTRITDEIDRSYFYRGSQ